MSVAGRELGKSPVALRLWGNEVKVTARNAELGIDFTDVVRVRPGQDTVRWSIPRGSLHVRVVPYSEVTLDGKALGEGPYPVMPAYAGKHQLLIVNRALNVRRRETVQLAAGEDRVFRLKLK
ncbi:MAG: hypothetical protein IPJ65_03755 [Archangiaceae bacterium]|nr:hypothetical protein [Archangiaceae bacterium]